MAASLRLVHRLNRRAMRRDRIFRDRIRSRSNPLDIYDDNDLFKRFRFPRSELLYVIDQFGNELGYEFDRKGSLPPAMQILIALRFYASGSFQEVILLVLLLVLVLLIGDTFGVSKATVCRTIHSVRCDSRNLRWSCQVWSAGWAETYMYVSGLRQIGQRQNFTKLQIFLAWLGALIDCTHVKIVSPRQYEKVYVNRKGYHSIHVQLVCDADLKIINAVVKMPGSAHDARIVRESIIFDAFESVPPPLNGHLLGDNGYMLRYVFQCLVHCV